MRAPAGMAAALACWVLLAACGAGPDRLVSARTGDGLWKLSLETDNQSLKPGESAAVHVRLTSLAGQPVRTFRDTIQFIANAGTVTPSRLVFTFVGAGDSLATGVTTVYDDWVTYTLSTFSSQANATRQGEVIAIFRDVQATLKLRIVD